jgi:hypothetical protein
MTALVDIIYGVRPCLVLLALPPKPSQAQNSSAHVGVDYHVAGAGLAEHQRKRDRGGVNLAAGSSSRTASSVAVTGKWSE